MSELDRSLTITRLEGVEHVDSLAELYRHLHEAQTKAAPRLGHMPGRTAEASWARRRQSYESWLDSPDAFLLLARREGRPVGFALVAFAGAYSGWESGERVAELKDLAVAPAARRQGIGSALLDRLEAELRAAGVSEYRLNVIAPNEDAIRLYRRRGMVHVTTVMLGQVSLDASGGASTR